MNKWLLVAVGLILLFAAQRECAADGKFFPPLNVKAPDMPQQRAIIVHRNGVERLIIESAFEGETGEYAWILPVPSEPLEIKKASYPLFKTMFYDLRQFVYPENWMCPVYLLCAGLLALLGLGWSISLLTGRTWVFWVCNLAAALFLWFLLGHEVPFLVVLIFAAFFAFYFLAARKYPKASNTTVLVLWSAALLLTIFTLLYTGGTEQTPFGNVDVGQTASIGEYDATTLKAENADALDSWLTAHGFQTLGEKGRSVAGDYIRDKWSFIAARLHNSNKGLAAPAPLEVSFKADSPVYPMRLTALAGGPLFVDLIIVASEAYESKSLRTEMTDTWSELEYRNRITFSRDCTWNPPLIWRACGSFRLLAGDDSRHVHHTDAPTLLWHGCTVSKMSGVLTPDQMAEDLRPVRSSTGKYGLNVTYGAAAYAGGIYSLFFLWFAAVVVTAYAFFRYTRLGRDVPFLKWLHYGMVLLAALVGVAIWLSMHTAIGVKGAPEEEDQHLHQVAAKAFQEVCAVPGGSAEKLKAIAENDREHWPIMSDETRSLFSALEVGLAKAIKEEGLKNPLTGEPLKVEQSPGNLWVQGFWGDSKLYLVLFDMPSRFLDMVSEYPVPPRAKIDLPPVE
ncbi:MAG: DUF2330 domain-containing protein [Candidatus Brocadiia bacterium]